MAKKAKYYQRPDGLFEAIRTINGKRVAFRGKTCREVDRKILEYKEDKAKGRYYKEILSQWWNEKEAEWSASSISAYSRAYKRVVSALGNYRLSELRPIDFERYLAGMKQKGYRSGTVGLDISVLKMSCSRAVIYGDIDINPCAEIKRPKGLYAKKRDALTEDQIADVIKYRGKHWLFGLMLLYTGCRRGELLALHYEDIDRKRGVIHINKKLNYSNGNIPFMENHTKTEAGIREIVLLPGLDEALPKDRIGLIFHEKDGSPWKSATISKAWKEYCEGIGFPFEAGKSPSLSKPKITPHCLRHTFVTMCFDADIDPKTTAAMLGHADEAITISTYTHLTQTHKAKAHEQLKDYVRELETLAK